MSVVDFRDAERAADGEPEIVVSRAGAQQGAVLSCVGVGASGIESFIGEVLVAAAVILVGAGSRRDVNEATCHLPEFGGEVTALQRHLLEGVGGRLEFTEVGRITAAGCDVLAVHQSLVGVVDTTIDANGKATRVWRVNSGGQQHAGDGIPNTASRRSQRQGVDLIAIDGLALLGTLCLQQRRVRHDRD